MASVLSASVMQIDSFLVINQILCQSLSAPRSAAQPLMQRQWGTLENVALATPLAVNRPLGADMTVPTTTLSLPWAMGSTEIVAEPSVTSTRFRRKTSQREYLDSVATHRGPRYWSVSTPPPTPLRADQIFGPASSR